MPISTEVLDLTAKELAKKLAETFFDPVGPARARRRKRDLTTPEGVADALEDFAKGWSERSVTPFFDRLMAKGGARP